MLEVVLIDTDLSIKALKFRLATKFKLTFFFMPFFWLLFSFYLLLDYALAFEFATIFYLFLDTNRFSIIFLWIALV